VLTGMNSRRRRVGQRNRSEQNPRVKRLVCAYVRLSASMYQRIQERSIPGWPPVEVDRRKIAHQGERVMITCKRPTASTWFFDQRPPSLPPPSPLERDERHLFFRAGETAWTSVIALSLSRSSVWIKTFESQGHPRDCFHFFSSHPQHRLSSHLVVRGCYGRHTTDHYHYHFSPSR
jgi:hypothetical protein